MYRLLNLRLLFRLRVPANIFVAVFPSQFSAGRACSAAGVWPHDVSYWLIFRHGIPDATRRHLEFQYHFRLADAARSIGFRWDNTSSVITHMWIISNLVEKLRKGKGAGASVRPCIRMTGQIWHNMACQWVTYARVWWKWMLGPYSWCRVITHTINFEGLDFSSSDDVTSIIHWGLTVCHGMG